MDINVLTSEDPVNNNGDEKNDINKMEEMYLKKIIKDELSNPLIFLYLFYIVLLSLWYIILPSISIVGVIESCYDDDVRINLDVCFNTQNLLNKSVSIRVFKTDYLLLFVGLFTMLLIYLSTLKSFMIKIRDNILISYGVKCITLGYKQFTLNMMLLIVMIIVYSLYITTIRSLDGGYFNYCSVLKDNIRGCINPTYNSYELATFIGSFVLLFIPVYKLIYDNTLSNDVKVELQKVLINQNQIKYEITNIELEKILNEVAKEFKSFISEVNPFSKYNRILSLNHSDSRKFVQEKLCSHKISDQTIVKILEDHSNFMIIKNKIKSYLQYE